MKSALAILNQGKAGYAPASDGDQEGWMVAYADLITLLFVFFSILLSISSVSKTKLDMLEQQVKHQSASTLTELKNQLETEIKRQNVGAEVHTELSNEGLQIQFNERVLFRSGEANMSDEGSKVLQQFCGLLSTIKGQFHLAVEGHTDSRPIHTVAFASNWALSAARSVNVLHFLSAHGVDEKTMMVRAFADTRPSNSKDTLSAQNRRVTLLVF